MNVIKPVTILDSNFTYSNVPEPDTGEALWVAATSYTLGQEVIRNTTHRKYKNILAGIDAGLPEVTPTRWTESGVTNKWAVLDTIRNTQSTRLDNLTVKLMNSELIDAIGIVGISGQSINVNVVSNGQVVYDYTQSLFKRTTSTWYQWAFSQFRQLESVVRLDLPIYANAEVTITIYNQGELAKCGGIIIGRKVYIGDITYASSGDDLNFSTFNRALDGTSTLVPRRSVPTVDGELIVGKENVDIIRNVKKSLNGVATIWTGLNDDNINDFFELFLIYGLFKQFSIKPESSHAKIILKLEEF